MNELDCVSVLLLEYNCIVGTIKRRDLTKRRLKSHEKISKLIKKLAVKPKPAVVLHVNVLKNDIDLSIRHVSREKNIKCDYRFQREKIVHSIIYQVSVKAKESIETLYTSLTWPLAKIYGSNFEAIQLVRQFPDEVFCNINYVPNKCV